MLGGCSLSTPKWSCRKCCYHFTQNPCGGTISVIAMFQQSDNACASTAESLSCGSEGGGCGYATTRPRSDHQILATIALAHRASFLLPASERE